MSQIGDYISRQNNEIILLRERLKIAERIQRNHDLINSMSNVELQVYNSNERRTLASDPVYSLIGDFHSKICGKLDESTVNALSVRSHFNELYQKMLDRQMTEQEYTTLSSMSNEGELLEYFAKQEGVTLNA